MSLAFAITNARIRNEKARSDYAPSPNPQVLSWRATSAAQFPEAKQRRSARKLVWASSALGKRVSETALVRRDMTNGYTYFCLKDIWLKVLSAKRCKTGQSAKGCI